MIKKKCYSKVEFKNCSKSCRFASRSWSPLSFFTLSLICTQCMWMQAKLYNQRTYLFASKNTSPLFFIFLLLFLVPSSSAFAFTRGWTVSTLPLIPFFAFLLVMSRPFAPVLEGGWRPRPRSRPWLWTSVTFHVPMRKPLCVKAVGTGIRLRRQRSGSFFWPIILSGTPPIFRSWMSVLSFLNAPSINLFRPVRVMGFGCSMTPMPRRWAFMWICFLHSDKYEVSVGYRALEIRGQWR